MSTGTWTTGPAIDSARSDLALAATGTAVYALGGDNDGGGFFDATATAERLDVTTGRTARGRQWTRCRWR